MYNINNCISPKQVITIFNILRDIGINTTHKGSKYLNKAIQLLLTQNNDIVVIENVYFAIANYYGNISAKQVKNSIAYALNSRIEEKTIRNFKKIFNFEYDPYYFINKTLIEEICRIVEEF
ncbi:MAG: hypothetical protein J6A36_02340 [Clostridia bacterium]|nr:hypothetical protein [Clostridia bacterium]